MQNKETTQDKHGFFAKSETIVYCSRVEDYTETYDPHIPKRIYKMTDDSHVVFVHNNLGFVDNKKIYMILDIENGMFYILPYYDGLKYIEILKALRLRLKNLVHSDKEYEQVITPHKAPFNYKGKYYENKIVYNAYSHICYINCTKNEKFIEYDSIAKFILQVFNSELYMRPLDYYKLLYTNENTCKHVSLDLLVWLYKFMVKFGNSNSFTRLLEQIINDEELYTNFGKIFYRCMNDVRTNKQTMQNIADFFNTNEMAKYKDFAFFITNNMQTNPFNNA